MAAFDVTNPNGPAAGTLTNFAPTVNSTVKAIYANASTVYFGGNFTSVNTCSASNVTGCNATRSGAAAVAVATPPVTGFNPCSPSAAPVGDHRVAGQLQGRRRRQLHHRQRRR